MNTVNPVTQQVNTQDSTQLVDIAQNKPAFASSIQSFGFDASKAVDGSNLTRWASTDFNTNTNPVTPQWICIDLESTFELTEIQLCWEDAFGKSYKLQISNETIMPTDESIWVDVYSTQNGNGHVENIKFGPIMARYVRMLGLERGRDMPNTQLCGYSLWKFGVYGVHQNSSPRMLYLDNQSYLAINNVKITTQAMSFDIWFMISKLLYLNYQLQFLKRMGYLLLSTKLLLQYNIMIYHSTSKLNQQMGLLQKTFGQIYLQCMMIIISCQLHQMESLSLNRKLIHCNCFNQIIQFIWDKI
ncbi:discoidin_domain-containing protein [Hexamita inflata]|uniref:Discoidin domain-containing protein n=1 Tax=Hexamita inflata TaxID=28002 RepID=A0AA86Q4D8_9EUKA|nr:discoidin domain-containing protein [Hexamita inflata]